MKYENEIRGVYDNLSKKYQEITVDNFFNAYLEVPATSSLMKKVKGKKVLDLGCGTGRHTVILKRRGAKLWGIDLSPKMIDIAKSEIKGVDFRVGTVFKLPYKSGFFDFVLAGLCISYFKELDRALREVNRVLKSGGIFVFSTTNPFTQISMRIKDMPEEYRIFGDYFKEGKMYSNWTTFKVKMPYYHMTLQTLIRALVRNGFVIEDFLEERPIKASKRLYPVEYNVYSKIPYFIAFKVRKK